MTRLVLVRHGQSEWNQQNRFTGWVDVDLTDRGREEADVRKGIGLVRFAKSVCSDLNRRAACAPFVRGVPALRG